VAQLTIYVPEAVAKRLKAEARRARKSVSAVVVGLVEGRGRPRRWPKGFEGLYGSCRGELPVVEDQPPEGAPEL
jgi:hypothetical protein